MIRSISREHQTTKVIMIILCTTLEHLTNKKVEMHMSQQKLRTQNLGTQTYGQTDMGRTDWSHRRHDDVIKWKHFQRHWPLVRGIHRSPVNSPHKGQWRGALMFFICVRIKGRGYYREAGDLSRHRTHYGVTVMENKCPTFHTCSPTSQYRRQCKKITLVYGHDDTITW